MIYLVLGISEFLNLKIGFGTKKNDKIHIIQKFEILPPIVSKIINKGIYEKYRGSDDYKAFYYHFKYKK